MRRSHAAPAALLALAAALPAAAQKVGSRVPGLPLAEICGSRAASFEDFVGRTLLIEYFAYW